MDERSDIYSLGVTLFELYHLRRPFPDLPPGSSPLQALDEMAALRRYGTPRVTDPPCPETDTLDKVIRRCLEPVPADRFQSATELCEAFDAARQLHGIRKSLPQPGRLIKLATQHPLTMLVLAVLAPSLLGSAVNISYNFLRIVPALTAEQVIVFKEMLLVYNVTVYPICSGLMVYLAWPIFFPQVGVDRAWLRRRVIALPLWIVALGTLGWLPGGLLFPLGLHLTAGPLEPGVFGHFLIDFAISGLIAVTYSYFGAETILLRVLYSRFLVGQKNPQEVAHRELEHIPRRVNLAQFVAGLIPLAGAILIVALGPAESEGYRLFQLLVITLIVLGMVGFCLSTTAANVLRRTLQALTGVTSPTQSTGR